MKFLPNIYSRKKENIPVNYLMHLGTQYAHHLHIFSVRKQIKEILQAQGLKYKYFIQTLKIPSNKRKTVQECVNLALDRYEETMHLKHKIYSNMVQNGRILKKLKLLHCL